MNTYLHRYLRLALAGLLLAAVMMMPSDVYAAKRTVLVNNVYDMMAALGDDTEIVLAPGRYNLSTWKKGNAAASVIKKMEYNLYSPAGLYDMYDMEICGYKNLTIRGRDVAAITAEIVIEEPYDTVLNFTNCKNLTLANISVGHSVEKGTCSGAVLGFKDSSYVDIKNADLYGCGTYGYEAHRSDNINVYDSVIRECTYGLVSAYECTNLRFLRTTFKDTKTNLSLFWMRNSQLDLKDCTFRNVQGPMDGLHVTTGVQASNSNW